MQKIVGYPGIPVLEIMCFTCPGVDSGGDGGKGNTEGDFPRLDDDEVDGEKNRHSVRINLEGRPPCEGLATFSS